MGFFIFPVIPVVFGQCHPVFQLSLNGRVLTFSFSKGLQCQSTSFSEFCSHFLARTIGYIPGTHPSGEYVQESSKSCRLDRQV